MKFSELVRLLELEFFARMTGLELAVLDADNPLLAHDV